MNICGNRGFVFVFGLDDHGRFQPRFTFPVEGQHPSVAAAYHPEVFFVFGAEDKDKVRCYNGETGERSRPSLSRSGVQDYNHRVGSPVISKKRKELNLADLRIDEGTTVLNAFCREEPQVF